MTHPWRAMIRAASATTTTNKHHIVQSNNRTIRQVLVLIDAAVKAGVLQTIKRILRIRRLNRERDLTTWLTRHHMILKVTADLDQDLATTKEENAARAVAVGGIGATPRVQDRVKAQSSDYLRRSLISLSNRRRIHIRTLFLEGSPK